MLNGQIDRALLAPIPGTSFLLRAGAAAAWAAVCHEVQRRFGWTPALNDAYRSESQQIALFLARYRQQNTGSGPYGDVRFWKGARYVRISAAGSVAVPGTSNHGLGVAVDVASLGAAHSTRWTQFATVAQPLGWSWNAALGEPWHWDYAGSADTVSNVVSQVLGQIPAAPNAPIFTAPVPEEDDMPTLIFSSAGYGLLDGGRYSPIGDQATVDSWKAQGAKQANYTDADLRRLLATQADSGISPAALLDELARRLAQ